MKGRPGIGIVNAHWHLHSSIAYLASCLEEAGYRVDIFLYHSDERLSGDLVKESPFVMVHRFDTRSPKKDSRLIVPKRWTYRLRRLRRYLPLKADPAIRRLIPSDVVSEIIDICLRNNCVTLIGVEKGGLGIAGAVAKATRLSLVYYSLELYTWDHPWVMVSRDGMTLKVIEEHYHRACALTIIQDDHRGRALLDSNRVSARMPMAYLPVSLSGLPNTEPSQWLQRELGLGADTTVILSYGMMSSQRRCVDLAHVAQTFPDHWRLVFHGYGSGEIVREIEEADVMRRVCISQRLLPARDREMIVRSAHIGLAIYDAQPLNDRLTGRASEKIAIYLKGGLPLIAFRHTSYEHIELEQAGVLIDRLDDIPSAVEKILRDYDNYVTRAYDCFRRHYCFEENFVSVLNSLRAISS